MQGTIRIRYLDWAAPQPDALDASAVCDAGATADVAAAGAAPDRSSAERPAAASAPAAEPGMPPAVAPGERFETIIASDVLYEVWPPPHNKSSQAARSRCGATQALNIIGKSAAQAAGRLNHAEQRRYYAASVITFVVVTSLYLLMDVVTCVRNRLCDILICCIAGTSGEAGCGGHRAVLGAGWARARVGRRTRQGALQYRVYLRV